MQTMQDPDATCVRTIILATQTSLEAVVSHVSVTITSTSHDLGTVMHEQVNACSACSAQKDSIVRSAKLVTMEMLYISSVQV